MPQVLLKGKGVCKLKGSAKNMRKRHSVMISTLLTIKCGTDTVANVSRILLIPTFEVE